jgi:hypothetical protein
MSDSNSLLALASLLVYAVGARRRQQQQRLSLESQVASNSEAIKANATT